MDPTPDTLGSKATGRIGLGLCLLGMGVLCGWLFHIESLRSVLPGLVSMKVNTALAFILVGIGFRSPSRGLVLMWPVLVIASATAAESLFLGPIGIDEWLVKDHTTNVFPGRMGLNTALCFAAIAGAGLLHRKRILPGVAHGMAALACAIAFIAFAGYLLSAEKLIGLASYTPMALHTTLGMMAATVGSWGLRSKSGWVSHVVSDEIGGELIRIAIPFAVLVPMVGAVLRLKGQERGWYGTEFGLAMFATLNVVAFSTFILWMGAKLNRVGTARRHIQEELQKANDTLEHRVEERTLQLAHAEARTRMAVEGANIGIWHWDSVTDLLEMSGNARTILGVLPEARPSMREILSRVPRAERHIVTKAAKDAIEQHLDYEVTFHLLDANGSLRWIFTKGQAQAGQKDSYPPLEGIVWDITEREAADRMKHEFVSVVSHELRTPLTSIHGALRLLEGGIGGRLPEEASSLISIASSNCQRLILLVNDILDMEKIQAGRMEYHLTDLDMRKLLTDSLDQLRTFSNQCHVGMELAMDDQPAPFRGDGIRVMQILSNLLSNALKFSPSGGVVQIGLERLSGKVRVFISDEGQGIPEEFRPRIFTPFTQANTGSGRSQGGTGLGLCITKSLVEGMGGTLGFESEVGKGSTFWFEFESSLTGSLI